MTEITFFYGTMNSGKSTAILQQNYNLKNSGFRPFLCKPEIDTRTAAEVITSRIGLSHECLVIPKDTKDITEWFKEIHSRMSLKVTHFLIDEVQFLNYNQTYSMFGIADELNIPIFCYGLRTSWKGTLFEASSVLFAFADNLIELPYTSKDSSKTTAHIKTLNNQDVFPNWNDNIDMIEVGDMDKYESVSRKEFIKRYKEFFNRKHK